MLVLVAAAAIGWVILLLAAPVLSGVAGAVVYGLGSLICHQIPDRSFHVAGFQLPVCARCLGLYVGGAAGLLAGAMFLRVGRPFVRFGTSTAARRAAAVAAVPTIVTLAVEWVAGRDPGNVVRALAGMPFAFVAGVVVANALATLHYDECAPPRPIGHRPPPPST